MLTFSSCLSKMQSGINIYIYLDRFVISIISWIGEKVMEVRACIVIVYVFRLTLKQRELLGRTGQLRTDRCFNHTSDQAAGARNEAAAAGVKNSCKHGHRKQDGCNEPLGATQPIQPAVLFHLFVERLHPVNSRGATAICGGAVWYKRTTLFAKHRADSTFSANRMSRAMRFWKTNL